MLSRSVASELSSCKQGTRLLADVGPNPPRRRHTRTGGWPAHARVRVRLCIGVSVVCVPADDLAWFLDACLRLGLSPAEPCLALTLPAPQSAESRSTPGQATPHQPPPPSRNSLHAICSFPTPPVTLRRAPAGAQWIDTRHVSVHNKSQGKEKLSQTSRIAQKRKTILGFPGSPTPP